MIQTEFDTEAHKEVPSAQRSGLIVFENRIFSLHRFNGFKETYFFLLMLLFFCKILYLKLELQKKKHFEKNTFFNISTTIYPAVYRC